MSTEVSVVTQPTNEEKAGKFSLVSVKAVAVLQKVASPLLLWRDSLRGVNAWSIGLGLIFSIFVLAKYISPVVGKLALEPIVAPLAVFGMLISGQLEAAKLQTMLAENLGVVAVVTGMIISWLFVQNSVKSIVFAASFLQPERNQRAHAVAGLLAPLTTSFLWYLAVGLGYYPLTMKSIGVGILALFAGSNIASILASVNITIVDNSTLKAVEEVAKAARWSMLIMVSLRLILVGFTYVWIYRGLEKVFSLIHSRPGFVPLTKVKDFLFGLSFSSVVVALAFISFCLFYSGALPWNIALIFFIPPVIVLTEEYRLWIKDDNVVRRLSVFLLDIPGDMAEAESFTSEEANFLRATRRMILWLIATCTFVILCLIPTTHFALGVGVFLLGVAGSISFVFRNQKMIQRKIERGDTVIVTIAGRDSITIYQGGQVLSQTQKKH